MIDRGPARHSVIRDLKRVTDQLENEGSRDGGLGRLLSEWDGLKTLVVELRDEIKGLKNLLVEERLKK